MVQDGKAIQEGHYITAPDGASTAAGDSNDLAAAAPANSEDGAIYFASVKASQQELDRAGSAAAGTGRAAAAALALAAGAQAAGLDFSRLRAATGAALAAAGLTPTEANSLNSSNPATVQAVSNSAPDSSTAGAEDFQATAAATQAADVPAQQQQTVGNQDPVTLCMRGSWDSNSTEEGTSSVDGGHASMGLTGLQTQDSTLDQPAELAEPSQGMVAPEDVQLLTESSGAEHAGAESVGTDSTTGRAATDRTMVESSSLYDLD